MTARQFLAHLRECHRERPFTLDDGGYLRQQITPDSDGPEQYPVTAVANRLIPGTCATPSDYSIAGELLHLRMATTETIADAADNRYYGTNRQQRLGRAMRQALLAATVESA